MGLTFSFKGPLWTEVCFFGKKVPFFVFSSNNSRRWQRLILGILPQSFAKNGGAVHALIFLFVQPTSERVLYGTNGGPLAMLVFLSEKVRLPLLTYYVLRRPLNRDSD